MKPSPLPVVDRVFELIKWYSAHITKFPRAHRYGLGARIEDRLYGVMEKLVQAQYSDGALKLDALMTVNTQLEVLRFLTRLANELAVLPHKSHEFANREMNEIGRMVGGWIRQQRQTRASSNA